jgi:hypothetical protein
MMHPTSAAAVTLSGRDGLLSAVPPLLGFHLFRTISDFTACVARP